MSVKLITSAILRLMPGINKRRQKFLTHLTMLYLRMRGRTNFLMMSRYGTYHEQTYRQNFVKPHDFAGFNYALIKKYCSANLIWAFDPSYLSKSGKHTPGVGYFWSGSASKVKWGLELSALAVVDLENSTAMHYDCARTAWAKGDEKLREYYIRFIRERVAEMLKLSNKIAFDAFFSKKEFVDSMCLLGLVMISRLQKNAYLRCAYLGAQKEGQGRKKEFGGRIDPKNLPKKHFTLIWQEENEVAYEGVLHVRSLKRWCKVVIKQKLDAQGKVKNAVIYFSTDLQMPGIEILQGYVGRYQIEFLFRDAKGHLGLEDCQSRQADALDFHFNTALTTLNVAKAHHWLSVEKEERGPFSMADVKTHYINEFLLDRLISIYGKCPQVEKNNPKILELYNFGRIAA
jgi:DDE superfamily endonuclease